MKRSSKLLLRNWFGKIFLTIFFLVVCFGATCEAVCPDGDIAPWGERDDSLNIGDAVVALRCSIGALTPTAEDITHGDVVPTPGGHNRRLSAQPGQPDCYRRCRSDPAGSGGPGHLGRDGSSVQLEF